VPYPAPSSSSFFDCLLTRSVPPHWCHAADDFSEDEEEREEEG
jgi:hypothetical protein